MARADKSTTKPDKGDLDRDKAPQQPGAQGVGKDANAIDEAGSVDNAKLQQNQEKLQVGADHKTKTMRKQHRGTFP
jgi:hypothetical protein